MFRKILFFIIGFITICITLVVSINFYVAFSVSDKIVEISDLPNQKFDAILVLGASVRGDEPSPMLENRIKKGVELYYAGYANKIIMSGDNSTLYYDEVNVMKDYAIEEGVPSEDIFMDHAGLSTYDSIYRAKEIFGVESVLIVSQEYHLYRAVYIAEDFDMSAYGVYSAGDDYSGQLSRDFREVFARNKDFVFTLVKPEPEIFDDKEVIPVSGNGDVTNDN